MLNLAASPPESRNLLKAAVVGNYLAGILTRHLEGRCYD